MFISPSNDHGSVSLIRSDMYSRFLRIAHALVACSATLALGISLVMDHPHRSRAMTHGGGLLFHWHEAAGLFALAVLVAGWAYRVMNWRRESQRRLFPWLTLDGARALARELVDFLRLRWTAIPESGALAGTVHGLGLLAITAMAITGGAIYATLGAQDTLTPTASSIMHLHSFIATFAWIYFCGHALMAVWHELIGHASLRRMFSFR